VPFVPFCGREQIRATADNLKQYVGCWNMKLIKRHAPVCRSALGVELQQCTNKTFPRNGATDATADAATLPPLREKTT